MLEIESLYKTYRTSKQRVGAVNDVTFTADDGVFLTLLGPSGCGKTTTLRSVAGLESPDSGVVRVAGETLFSSDEGINIPANRRNLGMVFQSYAIWPHMNVYENVAFPLKVQPRTKRLSRAAVRDKVDQVLEVVKLDGLGKRPATDLSGGQQQRLALARALVGEPSSLLLDEPLSNLDAKLREQLRFELKRLQRDLGVTTLYVTHDQSEALAMSNLLAVMEAGEIRQIGRPRDIYERPTSTFVADFIGTSNFIRGKVKATQGDDRYLVETEAGSLVAVSAADVSAGANVTVSVRPEHITLTTGTADAAAVSRWHGKVRDQAFLGEALDYIIDVPPITVRVRCNASLNLPADSDVTVALPDEQCSLLPAD